MRGLLGHFLALLLATALSLTVLLWTLGATLASAPFLEHMADQTGLYDHLTAGIPGADPAALRSSVNAALPQLIDYITLGGPLPTITIPGATDGPVFFNQASPALLSLGQNLRAAAGLAPVAVLVLVVLIIAVMGHLRLATLSRATFGSGIGLAFSAALLWFAPMFISQVSLKAAPEFIKAAVTPFLTALLHAVSLDLAIAAAVLVGMSLLLRALHAVGRFRSRFLPRRERRVPPLPPVSNER